MVVVRRLNVARVTAGVGFQWRSGEGGLSFNVTPPPRV